MDKRLREPVNGLPCPICGQTEHLTVTAKWFFDELVEENGQAMVSLECSYCNLELKNYNRGNKPYEEALTDLTAKWNTRAEVVLNANGGNEDE